MIPYTDFAVFRNRVGLINLLIVSEYPSLPKLPEIHLVLKENATANGTDDFSVFSLKCDVSTAKETNVKYELQWFINGAVSKTNTYTSTNTKGGKFESVLSGDSLQSLPKIDQVSESFSNQTGINHLFIISIL